jgi:hypothetical protein
VYEVREIPSNVIGCPHVYEVLEVEAGGLAQDVEKRVALCDSEDMADYLVTLLEAAADTEDDEPELDCTGFEVEGT